MERTKLAAAIGTTTKGAGGAGATEVASITARSTLCVKVKLAAEDEELEEDNEVQEEEEADDDDDDNAEETSNDFNEDATEDVNDVLR
jgi:hypothetical protein